MGIPQLDARRDERNVVGESTQNGMRIKSYPIAISWNLRKQQMLADANLYGTNWNQFPATAATTCSLL